MPDGPIDPADRQTGFADPALEEHVPERVAHLVEFRGGELHIVRGPLDVLRAFGFFLIGGIGGGGLGTLFGLLVVALGAWTANAPLLVIASFFAALMMAGGALLGALLVSAASHRKAYWPLGAGGIGRLSKAAIDRAEQLTLRGEPGGAIRFEIGGKRAFELPIRGGSRGWDYWTVTWLAGLISVRTELEVRDERDAYAWRRWENDSSYRALQKFERAARDSREAFAELHDAQPVAPAPEDVKVDLHGLRVTLKRELLGSAVGFRLEDGVLRLGSRSIPLLDIDAVDVVFSRAIWEEGQPVFARLRVLAGERVTTSGRVQLSYGTRSPGHMQWAVSQIQEAVAAARRSDPKPMESAEDVPDALLRMRDASRAAERSPR